MENDKCVIHEKDGSNRLLAAIQMTKNWMLPLRIETCFSSLVNVAPPKHACKIVHQKLALRNVKTPPSFGISGMDILALLV